MASKLSSSEPFDLVSAKRDSNERTQRKRRFTARGINYSAEAGVHKSSLRSYAFGTILSFGVHTWRFSRIGLGKRFVLGVWVGNKYIIVVIPLSIYLFIFKTISLFFIRVHWSLVLHIYCCWFSCTDLHNLCSTDYLNVSVCLGGEPYG